jgi:3-deoxy-D-manno-octulosonic-acid transferase
MRIEVAGPFVPVPAPPRCDEPDRDHYAHILHARPAWLAAFPTEAEIGPVIDAHSFALQGAHRLLLLVAPRDDAAGPALAERFRGEGWRVARYGAGEEPDHGTEIFVVDSREEIGLWYRLAPICVIGGTFRPDAVGAADPADAARLGSAILAGPVQAPHEAFFGRLAAAGGIARLEAPGDLGPALSDLLAPDKTAALAQPAWDVASDGARVQERIVAAIRDVLRDGGPG